MASTPPPKHIRLRCASCDRALGWRESRDNTRWILAICDDCYNEKDEAKQAPRYCGRLEAV